MADRLLLNERMLDIERTELCDANGHVVLLRPQALAVLLELARRRGEVVSKRDLMAHVWPGLVVTADSLVQCVVDIRHALGDAGQRIVRTVPRRGYMLIADKADAAHVADAPVDSPPAARRRYRAAAAALGLITAVGLSAWLFDSGVDAARRRVAIPRDGAVRPRRSTFTRWHCTASPSGSGPRAPSGCVRPARNSSAPPAWTPATHRPGPPSGS
jgi:DNA-binding winged helix-turn-helix (wHTH) protein